MKDYRNQFVLHRARIILLEKIPFSFRRGIGTGKEHNKRKKKERERRRKRKKKGKLNESRKLYIVQ
jgi:hypothetical protein